MKVALTDSYGHVPSQGDADAIRLAVLVLNSSDSVGAWEESANYHSAAAQREEMAEAAHVAQIDEWHRAADGWECAVCTICGRDLEREIAS